MRTFIQLRDGIGFATVMTPEGEPDHSVTPDNITAIEVFTENADQFLNKKYDEDTKSWSEAEVFVYGDVDENGRIIELRKTYFINDIGNKPIITAEVRPDWRWVNGEWIIPEVIDVEVIPNELNPHYIDIENESEETRLARIAKFNANNP
jgi:hypothetical protein